MIVGKSILSRKSVKVYSLIVIAVLLIAGSSLGLTLVRAASGSAVTKQYGPTLLSGSATTAKEPTISTDNTGQYVYVAWTEGGGGIYFTSSSNGGSSFATAFKISTTKGTASYPVMADADGYQSIPEGYVVVAWAQTVSKVLQIFVAVSTNYGAKGSWTTTQVSTAGGITPALAVSGNTVYVVWGQDTPCPATSINPATGSPPTTQDCDYVDVGTVTAGSPPTVSWTAPVEMGPTPRSEPQIVASGPYAYYIQDGIYFSSYGFGGNWQGSGWTTPIQLYQFYSYDPSSPSTNCLVDNVTGCLFSFGREPWIAAGTGSDDQDVYVMWEAVNLGNTKGTYSDYGATSTNGGASWCAGTYNPASCPSADAYTSSNLPPSFTNDETGQATFLITGSAPDVWEPEDAGYAASQFTTVHSLSGSAAVYVISTFNSGATWSAPQQVNTGMSGTSAYGHVFTSDGKNIWVMWGQEKSSSVWNAYVAYGSVSGTTTTWSSPLDISNNAAGTAAGNQDVTLFWVTSLGSTVYAAWTYTSGSTNEVMFASATG